MTAGGSDSSIGAALAQFLADRSLLPSQTHQAFRQIVAQLVQSLDDGHSCLPLTVAEQQLVQQSPLVSAGGHTPLVLIGGRLYLHRYFSYERQLADQCRERARFCADDIVNLPLLEQLFPADNPQQRLAAEIALRRHLCLISGGPGTGKTSTVAKIIALLLASVSRSLRIALCAPTGKAAMRLRESVQASLAQLALPESLREIFPQQSFTLHRLLGVQQFRPSFRYQANNPLPYDVVVVDEASMVDLALMAKLVAALPTRARLILLGDKDQLVSVESGAVFADLLQSLPGHRAELQISYRFTSTIATLADAVNHGKAQLAWQLLSNPAHPEVRLVGEDLDELLAERFVAYMQAVDCRDETGITGVFQAFRRFQVLCAHRRGAGGASGINTRVEQALRRKGYAGNVNMWYCGRPVLVGSNDYTLGLFNGDIGICLPDRNGQMQVWFDQGDGQLLAVPPYRLPPCETVYAMTVHKSQGSECDEVLLVLPAEDSRVLSRELLYTGITRARNKVYLATSQALLALAIERRVERHSGLTDFLATTM